MTVENRRCLERINLSASAEWLFNNTRRTGKIVNLSPCGIGLITAYPLNIGQELEVGFQIASFDNIHQLKIPVIVVHTSPVHHQFLIGLQIQHASEHLQRLITEYRLYQEHLTDENTKYHQAVTCLLKYGLNILNRF